MKQDSYRIIVRPLITEKGMEGVNSQNQYPFEVSMSANKQEIAAAIQEIFGVRAQKVRTMIRRGKPRRVRVRRGVTRTWKKAIITLVPGDTLEFI